MAQDITIEEERYRNLMLALRTVRWQMTSIIAALEAYDIKSQADDTDETDVE